MRDRTWLWTCLLVLALTVSWTAARDTAASNQIAKAEGQLCTACHDKPGSKLLTDEGKYYELMRTLEGYDQVTVAFGDCTTCHVREPGSHRLTDQGRRFAEMVGDMEGLRTFLVREHPTPAAEDGGEADGRDVRDEAEAARAEAAEDEAEGGDDPDEGP